MIKYNYFGKEQEICYEKLNNGLDIYIIPNNNLSNYHIEVVTKYGSSINEFIPINESSYIKLPLGVAHFLEHKLFDIENGDPFSFYSKTGTYLNAGTNYFYTTVIDKIAGTTESIKEITPDILMKTYETFYQPSNMFIVATGNVVPSEIIKVIKDNQSINKRITNKKIEYKILKEKDIVPSEYKLIEENIVVPKLSYTYKFNLDKLYNNRLDIRLYLSLLFTHLFGETSEFNEKVMENGIAIGFYMDHLSFDNTYAFTIEAESEYADLFKDEVDKAFDNINLSREDFERIKKMWVSVVIRSLDNKENLAYSVVDDIIKDGKVYDQLELINKLKYEELLKILNNLDLNNKSFVLMVPKN